MRKIMGVAAALMLAACGNGNSEDFAVDVAMAPSFAKAELAQLDGGIGLRALSLPAIVTDKSQPDELSFAMTGDGKTSNLRMRFEEVGTNGTRIHVSLSLPVAVAKIKGDMMYLSESNAEDMLEQRFKSWADRANSGEASLASLNEAMAGLSIAMQPGKLDEVMRAADDPEKLAAMFGPELLAELEGDSGEYLAAASELDDPMLDPDSGTWEASRPMDEADGSDADSADVASDDWGGGGSF